jgi:hypothetical protein
MTRRTRSIFDDDKKIKKRKAKTNKPTTAVKPISKKTAKPPAKKTKKKH